MSIISKVLGHFGGKTVAKGVNNLATDGKLNHMFDGVTNMIGQNLWNLSGEEQRFEKQKEMVDYENAINQENWNKQNEYNDPSAQMNRLRNAGINPLFGMDASNMAESMGQFSSMPNVDNPLVGLASLAATAAQVANLDADTAKKKAETRTEDELRAERLEQLKQQNEHTRSLIRESNLSADAQDIINKYLDAKEQALTMQAQKSVDLTKEQINLIEKEGEKLRFELDHILPANLDKTIKETGLLSEQILSERKNREYIDATMKQIEATIGKIQAETGLTLNDIVYYDENHASNGFLGTGLSIQNIVRTHRSGYINRKGTNSHTNAIKKAITSGQAIFGFGTSNP